MEILRQGADPKTQAIEADCNYCNTRIRFSPIEAKFVHDQRDGNFYQIECPVCANHITKAVNFGYNGPG